VTPYRDAGAQVAQPTRADLLIPHFAAFSGVPGGVRGEVASRRDALPCHPRARSRTRQLTVQAGWSPLPSSRWRIPIFTPGSNLPGATEVAQAHVPIPKLPRFHNTLRSLAWTPPDFAEDSGAVREWLRVPLS